MMKDIYDPLTEYVNVFHDRFREVAKDTFAELAAEAKIDVETNRETCRKLYAMEGVLASVQSRLRLLKVCSVVMWIGVAAGILLLFLMKQELSQNCKLCIAIASAVAAVLLLTLVHPYMKGLKGERHGLADKVKALRDTAWAQMAPLNRLYDWDVLTRMMSKTVPRLEFDPYFTTQRLADLEMTYGWDGSFNEDRSVVYSHSGLINGNPFVICRTKKMEMGEKTYYGSKTIYWTTRERDSDGKYRTVQHSQTLTASVTAPYPEYYEKTRLIYGNTAAPDLTFFRKKNGLAGKDNTLSYKWKKRQLKRKMRDLSRADFAMLTNEDFEVVFNTSNRNNNQQFALLFTPLAQENMLKLLEDSEAGFGDDFDFKKYKMINTIISDHMQELDLDMNPKRYHSFDYDKAEKDFYTLNAAYFRAIYFCLAPLLCVPMYQQIRSHQDIYGRDMQQHSSFWEHEALANFWGIGYFKHPACVTDCILKTTQVGSGGDDTTIKVYAYGYRVQQRLESVARFGGDGRWHSVPVYWDEYLPVTGTGQIYMQEDNDFQDSDITHSQRLAHINSVLDKADLDVYRRHIASRV